MLTGILIGEKTELPIKVQDALERTGTSHILATAGLHVGVVTALLLYGFRLARVPRRGNYLMVMFFLVCYAAMAGGRPSVVRAVLMACIYLFGKLLEREPDMFTSLMTAGVVLLISNPLNLFDMGFQLSFATVMTILIIMPFTEGVPHWINTKIPGWGLPQKCFRAISLTLSGCLFLSLAAQIGSFPLVWYYFNEISAVAIFANVLAVPLLAPVMGMSVLAILLSAINPLIASPFNQAIDLLLGLILRIIELLSAPTWAAFSAEPPPIWLLFAYYLLLWGSLAFLRQHVKQEDHSLEPPW
jgi:competence protein ComEC